MAEVVAILVRCARCSLKDHPSHGGARMGPRRGLMVAGVPRSTPSYRAQVVATVLSPGSALVAQRVNHNDVI